MRIYTHTKDGQRLSGKVITISNSHGQIVYKVSDMGGYDFYKRTFKTVLGVLKSVERKGHFVDLDG